MEDKEKDAPESENDVVSSSSTTAAPQQQQQSHNPQQQHHQQQQQQRQKNPSSTSTAATSLKRSLPSPHEVIGEMESANYYRNSSPRHDPQQQQHSDAADADAADNTPIPSGSKRLRGATTATVTTVSAATVTASTLWEAGDEGGGETPPVYTNTTTMSKGAKTPRPQSFGYSGSNTELDYNNNNSGGGGGGAKTPLPSGSKSTTTTPLKTRGGGVHRSHSSNSVASSASELSTSSSASTIMRGMTSPVPPSYISEVPPAPPSTPATTMSLVTAPSWDNCNTNSSSSTNNNNGNFSNAMLTLTPNPNYKTGARGARAGLLSSSSSFSIPNFPGGSSSGGLLSPMLQAPVLNANRLEQQFLSEGAVTPAPPRKGDYNDSRSGGSGSFHDPFADDSNTNNSSSNSLLNDEGPPTAGAPLLPLQEDFSDWAVGDRYEMVRLLGRGSYGEVAQALDLRAGKPDAFVAIKRIQSPFDQEVDSIRLYREIHILRQMRGHDCIIQLVDVVQPPTDDLDDFHDLYLVFEYVDTDLYKLILSPQYLTTQHIQTFLYQMLVGLKYIHSFAVIHRDLKPANILLNEDCSLKICDFGLARIVAESQMSSGGKRQPDSTDRGMKPAINNFGIPPKMGLTRQLTKHVVTRWYRAPELILIQPYTSAVDIWSLGCILAELLSMQEGNVEGYQDRKPLFPGGTCFPLSGEGKLTSDDKLDQLSVIFGVIGTPSKEDVEAIGKANEYIKSLGQSKGKSLEKVFPAADPSALDLLSKMLQFNPKRRLTADEALDHDFFKGVRQESLEVKAAVPLDAPEFLETNHVDLAELKRKIYEEVLWYRDKKEEEDEEMDSKMPAKKSS